MTVESSEVERDWESRGHAVGELHVEAASYRAGEIGIRIRGAEGSAGLQPRGVRKRNNKKSIKKSIGASQTPCAVRCCDEE